MEPEQQTTSPVAADLSAPEKQTNRLAVTSLVCGILSIVLLGILTAIPAVICGHISRGQLQRAPDQYSSASNGIALAGIITGYISIALTLLIIIPFVLFTLSNYSH